MKLLYIKEHQACYNYDGGSRPAVESIRMRPGERRVADVAESEILMVLEGRITVSFERVEEGKMTKGDMVLIPPCTRVMAVSEETAELLVFRIRTDMRFCDGYSLERLYEDTGKDVRRFEGRLNTIKANERVDDLVSHFMAIVGDGLRCIYFYELKIRELFLILRAYYTKRELAAFFSPMLSADYGFLNFVFKNYEKVHSVKELAVLAGYSISGFDKQFRKVFGMSAYQWMKHKRLNNIFHDINCSSRTFREISSGHGFSSLSQFNDYCKKNFGLPPGKIRRKEGCVMKPE